MVSGNLLGGILAVISSIFCNIGTNIQKHSHVLEAERVKEGGVPISFWMRSYWWVGTSFLILGAFIDFAAYGFGNQSLVAALGGSTILICNVFIGYFWHHEKVYRSDITGCVLVLAGSCWFAATAQASDKPTANDIHNNYQSLAFQIFVVIQGFLVCVALGTIANTKMYEWRASLTRKLLRPIVRDFKRKNEVLEQRVVRLEKKLARMESTVNVMEHQLEIQQEIDGDDSDLLPTSQQGPENIRRTYRHWSDCYIYASTSGMVGGFSVLFASVVSKLLFHDPQQGLQEGFFYASLAGMLISVFFQIQLLNQGLEIGDVMVVLPVFQAFWITFGVISGIVFYKRGAISLPGLFLICMGVLAFLRHGILENRQKKEI